MKSASRLTGVFGLVQASFWMSLCLSISFAAVHLKALGFSNAELGLVMAAGNVLGSLAGPVLTALAERRPRLSAARLNRPLFALRVLALLGLLLFAAHDLPSAVLYALYIAVMMPVNSLNLKFCVDAEQRSLRLDYGVARAAGSLAYVLLSVALGIAVKRLGEQSLVWTGFFVLLLQILFNELMTAKLLRAPLPTQKKADLPQPLPLLRFLRKEPRFTLFLLGSILLYFSHNAITNFMINLVRNVGGDEETMGFLNAFMAVVELPVMLLFSRFARGRRISLLLQISVGAFLAKALAFALAPSIPLLFGADLLQAPSFALYTCAVVPYVNEVIPRENAAKAQSLAFSITTLGAVGASSVGGWLFDHCSVMTTLLISAAVCAAGVAICIPSVKKTAVSR